MDEPLRVFAFGVVVEIEVSVLSHADADRVREAWRDALADPDATVDVHVSPTAAGLERVLSDLSTRVTLAAIEARRGRVWMLHAAGLALPDGRVVALVGPSGRGKTTASRALGRHLGYVTDETVAIDETGRVWPYRKPLSIIEDGSPVKAQRSPSSIGLAPLPDAALRLAAIVLLDRVYDPHPPPSVEPLDLGDAVAELVEQSSYLSLMPAPLQTIAAHIAAVGGLHRVTYSEADTLLSVILSIVDVDGDATPVDATPVAAAPDTRVPDAGTPDTRSHAVPARDDDSPLYSRGNTHDVLALDDPDRLVTLHVDAEGAGTVRVLGGVAPAVWRAAASAPLAELVRAAVDVYGEPAGGDAFDIVAGAVAELVEAGVLIESDAGPAETAPGWRIRDDVAWTGEGPRFVALALSDPSCTPRALEGSAALVWSALATGGGATADVIARVASSAGVTDDVVADDVTAFLHSLRETALVTDD